MVKLNKKTILGIVIGLVLLVSVVLFLVFGRNLFNGSSKENETNTVEEQGMELTKYIGHWYTDKKRSKSSKIDVNEVNENQVVLSLSIYGGDEFEDIIATMSGNAGTFVTESNVKGGVVFDDDQIIITIVDSESSINVQYMFKYKKMW